MRTVMDSDGNKYQVPDVINATIEHLVPQEKTLGWFCRKCSNRPMDLLPISKNVPPEYWICRQDENHKVTIQERDAVFEVIRKNILDANKLEIEVFDYDRKTNVFRILGVYQGRSHHTSTRRTITKGSREILINQLLNTIKDTLNIEVDNFMSYFIE